jgi:hypothetical protein
MSVKARDTEPGRFYRRTRGAEPGEHFTRPRRSRYNSPKAWARRLASKGHPLAGYWAGFLVREPDAVLMTWWLRGTSPLTGERWEVKRHILVVPGLVLREVKTRPGYSRG